MPKPSELNPFVYDEHARHLHNKHDLTLIAQALGPNTLTQC